MMENSSNWYAVYTKPRWEKKVDLTLKKEGIESYCPLTKVRKKWSDRYKVVNEPLFKSYGFVRILPSEMPRVRMINGVVNFLYWDGKPAIVKDWEIENIKRFLNEFDSVEVEEIDFTPDTRVVINSGVMMGQHGTIKRVLNNVVELRIESLGSKLVAKVQKSNIIPVE